jgi:hypothetical protein
MLGERDKMVGYKGAPQFSIFPLGFFFGAFGGVPSAGFDVCASGLSLHGLVWGFCFLFLFSVFFFFFFSLVLTLSFSLILVFYSRQASFGKPDEVARTLYPAASLVLRGSNRCW